MTNVKKINNRNYDSNSKLKFTLRLLMQTVLYKEKIENCKKESDTFGIEYETMNNGYP